MCKQLIEKGHTSKHYYNLSFHFAAKSWSTNLIIHNIHVTPKHHPRKILRHPFCPRIIHAEKNLITIIFNHGPIFQHEENIARRIHTPSHLIQITLIKIVHALGLFGLQLEHLGNGEQPAFIFPSKA